ncbi:MAG: SDR family NAD(P)-dependent oxidoreductase [Lentisphaerae bacterium]|nr:SDR family NAD(P)-dependent oxidoreductase [Lentisphaerota bacterium]
MSNKPAPSGLATGRCLAGEAALVTGGGSGIGRAAAEALARAGAAVAVAGRSRKRLEAAQVAIGAAARAAGRADGACLALPLDVRDPAAAAEAVERVRARFGRLDILVAAAGTPGTLSRKRRLPFTVARMPDEEWDEVVDTNFKGVFYCNRAALDVMIPQGKGDIVNIASYPGSLRGSAGGAAYCAAKHAVMLYGECLAAEMRPHGVRVQTLLPGATDTPLLYGAGGGWMTARGVMAPSSVGAWIVTLIRMPGDAVAWRPTLLPFPGFKTPQEKD